MKWAILENQSTITKIESQPFDVLSSQRLKSNKIYNQGLWGTKRGIYRQWVGL